MRVPLAALALVLVAFAGCLSTGEGGPADASTPTGSESPSAEPTGSSTPTGPPSPSPSASPPPSEPPEEENVAPQASLNASAMAGDAPLNVTFAVEGTDADGDALTWSLDADGDGSEDAAGDADSLPSNVSFNFENPGLYKASLVVSDGELSDEATLEVNVTAAPEPVVFEGASTIPAHPGMETTGAKGCAGFVAGQNSRDCIFFTMDAALEGHDYVAATSVEDIDIQFLTACSATATETGHAYLQPTGATGTVPVGSRCVVMWFFGASAATMSLTVY